MKVGFRLSYANLISHTFPGLLLILDIWLAFQLTPFDLFNRLRFNIYFYKNYEFFSITLIIIYVISTLFGIVIDAFRHWIFREREKRLRKDVYLHIHNSDQLAIYNKIEEDYYFYYEAYINIAISMIIGLIFYIVPLYVLRQNLLIIILIAIIHVLIIPLLWSEGKYTLDEVFQIESYFLYNLKERKL
jgi:hypothetical protein